MDLTALLLSRMQFAFTISFHIIFPAFTIGLAAWLMTLEAFGFVTGRPIYRKLFDFWLRIFAVAFGLGVVSGIVMAFQFGTNWSELSRRSGNIQGGLLAYESFSAFMLEAAFFGILIFGRRRVPPVVYLLATVAISLGTDLSSFWILANNSWMQHPTGFAMGPKGTFVPVDWLEILTNSVTIVRWVHMILAAYVTTSFCVAATGAWYALQGRNPAEARVMLRFGLGLAAVLVPLQLVAGHLVGDYVVAHQPSKITALEGRWHAQQPAGEVLFGWPNPGQERNDFEVALPPPFGSLIDSMSTTAREPGIVDIPEADRPNVFHRLLHIPHHGGARPRHAGARLDRDLSRVARPARHGALAAVAGVPELSRRLRGDAHGLVHRRGRPPALGDLRPTAHRGRHDAGAHGRHGRVHAPALRRHLRRHLPGRHLLHLPDAEARPRGDRPAGGGHDHQCQAPALGAGRQPQRRRVAERTEPRRRPARSTPAA